MFLMSIFFFNSFSPSSLSFVFAVYSCVFSLSLISVKLDRYNFMIARYRRCLLAFQVLSIDDFSRRCILKFNFYHFYYMIHLNCTTSVCMTLLHCCPQFNAKLSTIYTSRLIMICCCNVIANDLRKLLTRLTHSFNVRSEILYLSNYIYLASSMCECVHV